MIAGRLSLLAMLLGGAIASSGVIAQSNSDEEELSQLLELLGQQTNLATNTRLNADFVPGMLSVLNTEQLQRRGFRTVWDALETLPGVITVANETGMRSISIRGVGEIFETGKVKLLLNGKALNASASATTGTLFDTPVEQVDRIELIRGPGSAVYGEFAFAGVLNVITRNKGRFYSAGIDSNESINASTLQTFLNDEADFSISLNLAASASNGEDINSGADRSPTGTPGYAPGTVNNKQDAASIIIDMDIGENNLLLQYQQSNRGDHFGTSNFLPPDNKQTVISETAISASFSRPFELSENLSGEWSLESLQNQTERNELFLGVPEVFGGGPGDDDIVADTLLEEQRLNVSINLQSQLDRHVLFAELQASDIEINASEQFINLDPGTNAPSSTRNEFPGPVDESQDRSSISLVLQDEFRIDDSVTLTTGVRLDDYEDIGTNAAPRIALVWRKSNHHIFKTQLARAFRPPSLLEVGGSVETSIDPETNDTFEIGHIFHGNEIILRNTVYLSKLDDLIVFQDSAPFGYLNSGPQDLYGYELEVENSISNKWDISGSLSLQNYKDDGLPGAADWILKLGVGYALRPTTRVHLQLNSTSERERHALDSRSDLPQQTRLDLSLQKRKFLGYNGLELNAGIRNLLEETLRHPAPVNTYEDDYPYSEDASFWVQLRYQPR